MPWLFLMLWLLDQWVVQELLVLLCPACLKIGWKICCPLVPDSRNLPFESTNGSFRFTKVSQWCHKNAYVCSLCRKKLWLALFVLLVLKSKVCDWIYWRCEIVPALKRLHVENTDEAVPLEVTKFISQAVRDLKNSKSHIKKPDGKEAAIISDVRRVIDECTPDGLPTKASEASLWLADWLTDWLLCLLVLMLWPALLCSDGRYQACLSHPTFKKSHCSSPLSRDKRECSLASWCVTWRRCLKKILLDCCLLAEWASP